MAKKNTVESKALFLELFYREKIHRLIQAIDYGLAGKAVISLELTELVKRAENVTRCNNICKSMYFCERRARHKGKHREGTLAW